MVWSSFKLGIPLLELCSVSASWSFKKGLGNTNWLVYEAVKHYKQIQGSVADNLTCKYQLQSDQYQYQQACLFKGPQFTV